jgi:hypothetical protein
MQWLKVLPLWFVAAAVLMAGRFGQPGGDTWRGHFFVDDYGAVHDGSTDDGPAIQAANDAAEAAGGKVVFGPGTYAFDDSLTIDASVTWEGAGRGNPPDWDSGTILYHIGTDNGKTSLRIGWDGDNSTDIDGITIKDLTIRADKSGASNKTGNCVHVTGVKNLLFDNVDIFHKAASDSGLGALVLEASDEDGTVTGVNFVNGHIWYPGTRSAWSGYGIILDSTVSDSSAWFNTDCRFSNFNMYAADSSFAAILIRNSGDTDSTNCNNHKFVNGYIDFSANAAKYGGKGLITENSVKRHRFLNVNFDGDPTKAAVQLDSGGQGVGFVMCRFDGVLVDFASAAPKRAKTWDSDGLIEASNFTPLSTHAIKLNPYAAGTHADTASTAGVGAGGGVGFNGQMWVSDDSLYIWLGGTKVLLHGVPDP